MAPQKELAWLKPDNFMENICLNGCLDAPQKAFVL